MIDVAKQLLIIGRSIFRLVILFSSKFIFFPVCNKTNVYLKYEYMFQVATVSLNYITPLYFKVAGGGMKLSPRMMSLYKLAALLWSNTQLKVRNLVGFHWQLNSNTFLALWNIAEAGKKRLCSWWFFIPWFKFPNLKIIYAWE